MASSLWTKGLSRHLITEASCEPSAIFGVKRRNGAGLIESVSCSVEELARNHAYVRSDLFPALETLRGSDDQHKGECGKRTYTGVSHQPQHVGSFPGFSLDGFAYLHKQAGQDSRKRAAVPFIATTDGQIAGYYTLSQYAIAVDAVPNEVAKKLPKYPMVSVTLLGRLAVSTEFRGQGLGEILLMDALHRSLESSKQVASAGVVVDAKDEPAAAFYRKYGFIELPKIENRLFLPTETIEQLFRRGT